MTGLDLSDFPVLADRSRREGSGNPTPLINPLAGRAPYGKGKKEKKAPSTFYVEPFYIIIPSLEGSYGLHQPVIFLSSWNDHKADTRAVPRLLHPQ